MAVLRDPDGMHRRWEVPKVERPPEEVEPEGPVLTQEDYDAIVADARAEGYAAGQTEGFEVGRQAAEAEAARLQSLARCLSAPFAELDAQVENELVALVIAVTRQLVRRELAAAPGEIIAVVREAMNVLPVACRQVALRMHPEDATLLRKYFAESDNGEQWQIVDDPLIERGGLRVTSETSQIDAQLETRLGAVISQVFGVRAGD